MARIRRAIGADVAPAAASLAAAFDGDPWIAWVVAGDRHRDRITALQVNLLGLVGVPHGEVWLAEDEHGQILGVAVWLLAGREVPPAAWTAVSAREADLMGDRDAVAAAAAATRHLRPGHPHHLLASLGVLPAGRRQGLGSALLAPVVARADTAGVDCYLETSVEGNLRFYGRLGFEVTGHLVVPGGGPPVWSLLRPPKRAAPRGSGATPGARS